MDLIKMLADSLRLPEQKIRKTIELLQDDNTVPFIARYRKEITGNLDEEQIQSIKTEYQRLNNLEERRQTILKTIEGQGKLNPELRTQILQANALTLLEDLYQPYRPKRRTRGTIAKEKGLEPLAEMIVQQSKTSESILTIVLPFMNQAVPNQESALTGAADIVAEWISDHTAVRQRLREIGLEHGKLISEKNPDIEDQRRVFDLYYDYELPIKRLRPHQILALNRGEKENILKVGISIPEKYWLPAVFQQFKPERHSVFFEVLINAIVDCADRLLLPAIARDIRRLLTEQAESHAIEIFARNLRALLLQPPLTGHTVLAIDPGFRTGSKVAVVDPTGKLLKTATIYPHPPHNKTTEAKQLIESLITAHHVTLIVIGNGTASRETEIFIASIIKKLSNVNYLITSEAGASVYSASKLARNEFPDLDVSMRGAISIARRVQDPLAELVKIDPKSIGVGLYQHDVNQSLLNQTVAHVVESVVNAVGVDLNTASAHLLTHVSGIGPTLAKKVLQYRDTNGAFNDRKELLQITGMGPKSFEQSAGFLRIRNGMNPLDATAIHPESYTIAKKVLEKIYITQKPGTNDCAEAIKNILEHTDIQLLATELNIGLPTLQDILTELARPGRDPRDDLPKPILRRDVLSMSDLTQGMTLKGTIRNVVDFGAFVDIGVKVDGLLHRSNIKQGKVIKVGDIIDVTIQFVDHERERIALAMKETMNDH